MRKKVKIAAVASKIRNWADGGKAKTKGHGTVRSLVIGKMLSFTSTYHFEFV